MQAMTEEAGDPPTIKGAGGVESYGAASLMMALALIGVAAVVLGGMLLAVMTNQGQRNRGWKLHACLGAVAVALLVYVNRNSFSTFADMLGTAVGVGIVWLLVAGMGLAVGTLTQPSRRARSRRSTASLASHQDTSSP